MVRHDLHIFFSSSRHQWHFSLPSSSLPARTWGNWKKLWPHPMQRGATISGLAVFLSFDAILYPRLNFAFKAIYLDLAPALSPGSKL